MREKDFAARKEIRAFRANITTVRGSSHQASDQQQVIIIIITKFSCFRHLIHVLQNLLFKQILAGVLPDDEDVSGGAGAERSNNV